MVSHPYGWMSLLPPIAAIVLAIATRRVVASLIAGIFVGSLVTTHGKVWQAIVDTCEVHLWPTLVDPGRLRVFSFTLMMGAMIGVMTRSGGMRGLINLVAPLANTRRRGQLTTWLLGMLIFFDDYANTILLGGTLRPICDR
ncbi:MAG: Na+/H+ antiporter NhaC family protein, partial [Planctomycetota bacterium]